MKRFIIFVLAAVACMQVHAQGSALDSAEMGDLAEIINLQKRLKSSPKMDCRFDGIRIRKGQNPYGDIIYNVDGKWIRKGQNPYGDIMFNIDD